MARQDNELARRVATYGYYLGVVPGRYGRNYRYRYENAEWYIRYDRSFGAWIRQGEPA